MDSVCPNSSAYEPSSLVATFHGIPHVDIDLNPSPDMFELSLNYFQAVIIWACVPILIIVCLLILLTVYFICICCCCCCQQHEKRSKASKGCCGFLVTLLILLSLGMVGVGFWAENELNRNILQSFDAARDAIDITENLTNTTLSFTYDQSGTETILCDLMDGIEIQRGSNVMNTLLAASDLKALNQWLGIGFVQAQDQVRPIDFGDLAPAFVSLDMFELARHWAVFAYLIVTAVILVLVAMSLCFSACCRSPICMVLVLMLFFILTFVMWLAVGANLALLVVSGDICFSPDALIRNFTTSTLPNNAATQELLDYYLICNQTCYPSPFQSYFDNATIAFMGIDTNEGVIQSYIDANSSSDPAIQMNLDMASMNFAQSNMVVGELSELANCEVINSAYLSILTNLCTEGYTFIVVLFAMACVLAVFMILILICGSFYAGLLSHGKEYDDETVVYDFPSNSGPSPWDSYGTQQNYTPYQESFHLQTNPQTLGSDPPKYTDLSQFNSENGNGAQFNSDGTVDMVIRPASRNRDIDLGEPLDA